MARKRKSSTRRAAKAGAPPGAPIYVGEDRSNPVHVSIIDYDSSHLSNTEELDLAQIAQLAASDSVTWLNIDGMHDPTLVERICRSFRVHPMWVEDLVNTASRPKAEWLPGQLLVIVRTATVDPADGAIVTEQNGFVLGAGWVLALQERPGDPWGPLRQRLKAGTTALRRGRADALLHALLDVVVDHYFVAIERLEQIVDDLEDAALTGAARDLPGRILAQKADLALLRAAIQPLRDAVAVISRAEESVISPETRPLWSDLSDHVAQAYEGVEQLRERLVSALEIHLAITNNQLNDVVKFLTLISSLFIPLTFIVGVYGMNFQHMPELAWAWGYPMVWGLMLLVTVAVIAYYRRRGWL